MFYSLKQSFIVRFFTERLRKYMTARRIVLRMEFVVIRIPHISVMRSAMMTEFVWFILTRKEQVFLML